MGIKKESMPYLFSAFKRVDEEKNRYIEGTGLGLSIVKQLADLMGGDIAVNSVYMKGSTFVVTLPQKIIGEEKLGELDFEKRHASGAREAYKVLFEAPKAHVLIVDDNETNLMVEAKLLQDTKINVDTAINGAECLKKTEKTRYDVILMDHLMPVMDGIQCLHEISRSFFADSSYMLSFSVLCSCVCSRLISPSVSSWHKQDNTLMHQSPGHIQRRTPYNF